MKSVTSSKITTASKRQGLAPWFSNELVKGSEYDVRWLGKIASTVMIRIIEAHEEPGFGAIIGVHGGHSQVEAYTCTRSTHNKDTKPWDFCLA